VINKILIIVLVLAGVGLNHFQAEANASDLDKIFSSNSASTTAPETAYLNPKEPAGERIGEFSKGYQKWQVYGSLSCCDDGKGEMYALHIGYGYFFMDDFSVNVDVLGSYIRSDIDDDGAAIGLDLIFRRHQFKSHDNQWSLFIEAGSGLQQQSTNFAGNRRFNFRILGGGGATFRVAENARLMAGMRYLHISDAGIEGGGGGFDGLQFYAGSMFPF
jgi:hypothetical protein